MRDSPPPFFGAPRERKLPLLPFFPPPLVEARRTLLGLSGLRRVKEPSPFFFFPGVIKRLLSLPCLSGRIRQFFFSDFFFFRHYHRAEKRQSFMISLFLNQCCCSLSFSLFSLFCAARAGGASVPFLSPFSSTDGGDLFYGRRNRKVTFPLSPPPSPSAPGAATVSVACFFQRVRGPVFPFLLRCRNRLFPFLCLARIAGKSLPGSPSLPHSKKRMGRPLPDSS